MYIQEQGDYSGSDHDVLIAKFRLTLKKVGKTTRPFRYDLNHKGGLEHHGQVPGWGRCSIFLLIVCAPARGGPAARREIR